jgi:phage baseplate assembly protein gpV
MHVLLLRVAAITSTARAVNLRKNWRKIHEKRAREQKTFKKLIELTKQEIWKKFT